MEERLISHIKWYFSRRRVRFPRVRAVLYIHVEIFFEEVLLKVQEELAVSPYEACLNSFTGAYLSMYLGPRKKKFLVVPQSGESNPCPTGSSF
jgi:hypothetical protein